MKEGLIRIFGWLSALVVSAGSWLLLAYLVAGLIGYVDFINTSAEEEMQLVTTNSSLAAWAERKPQAELTIYNVKDEESDKLAQEYSYDAQTATVVVKLHEQEKMIERGMMAIADAIEQCPSAVGILQKHKIRYKYPDGREVGYVQLR